MNINLKFIAKNVISLILIMMTVAISSVYSTASVSNLIEAVEVNASLINLDEGFTLSTVLVSQVNVFSLFSDAVLVVIFGFVAIIGVVLITMYVASTIYYIVNALMDSDFPIPVFLS